MRVEDCMQVVPVTIGRRAESDNGVREDLRLARLSQCGDAQAGQALLLRHIGYCYFVAKKFTQLQRADFEDSVQEAFMGLLHALSKFKTDRGCTFIGYACEWAFTKVSLYRFRTRYPLRLPTTLRVVYGRIQDIAADLAVADSPQEVFEHWGDRLKVSSKEVAHFMAVSRSALPLHDLPDEFGRMWRGVSTDCFVSQEATAEEVLCEVEQLQKMRGTIERTLCGFKDQRKRKIIERHFFKEPAEGLAEIARDLNISRERVRQLKEEALASLRAAIQNEVE